MDKKIKVMIVPAGTGMAISILKALTLEKDIEAIALDSYKFCPGFLFADKKYVVPTFDNESFWEKVYEIAEKEKIDVIVPSHDQLLYEFALRKEDFHKRGSRVLISPSETVEITRDKWLSYLKFKEVFAKSWIELDGISQEDFPLFIKPRSGSGSKDAYKVNNDEELKFYFKRIENPIIQEYLPGKEYSVDCLANENGKLIFASVRERIRTKAGISVESRIVYNDRDFIEIAEYLTKKMKFYGIFFFQAKKSRTGELRVTEINPRIAGTTIVTHFLKGQIYTAAIKMAIGEEYEDLLKEGKLGKVSSNARVVRYFDEVMFEDKKIERLIPF